MTPNTPAGGAVAFRYLHQLGHEVFAWTRWLDIEELHHYGADGNLVQGPHPEWRKVEYAYTQPPATVPADAVLALAEDLRRFAQGAEYAMSADEAIDLCANRLEALTRGEK